MAERPYGIIILVKWYTTCIIRKASSVHWRYHHEICHSGHSFIIPPEICHDSIACSAEGCSQCSDKFLVLQPYSVQMICVYPICDAIHIPHRYHIHDNAYSLAVEMVDHSHELRRCSKSRCRSEHSHGIIAPAIVISIFHKWHKLYVVVSHILHVHGSLFAKFEIVKRISI